MTACTLQRMILALRFTAYVRFMHKTIEYECWLYACYRFGYQLLPSTDYRYSDDYKVFSIHIPYYPHRIRRITCAR